MIRLAQNYLKIAFRNLSKSKAFSTINIFGLAIGMAACFLIMHYVYFEINYDQFHEKIDRIYRVPLSYLKPGVTATFHNTYATNHPAVGPALQEDFPQVSAFARAVPQTIFMNASSMTYTDETGNSTTFNEEHMYIADPSFLTIFSFPFVAGDAETVLAEPQAIAISQSTAKKYFGSADPLGKVLTLNGELPLKVGGVFEDIPENSHIQFDILISILTLGEKWGYDIWNWPEFYTYVLLTPGTEPEQLEAQFPSFINKYMTDIMAEYKFQAEMYLQPVSDIHLTSHYHKEAEINGSEKLVFFLSILAAFILLIAWINYINLSTVKSLDRAREVGLRKVVGADRGQLVSQFLFESMLVNLFALLLSAVLVFIFLPYFHQIIGKGLSESFWTLSLWQEPWFWWLTLAVFVSGALLVGFYPAWFLSSFQPAKVLKGNFQRSFTGISLRKALVTFQFILTIGLIMGTITVYEQLSFMRNQDLGYEKDQILVVKSPSIYDSTITNQIAYFKTELSKQTAIHAVTTSTEIPGEPIFGRNFIWRAGQEQSANIGCFQLAIDQDFFNTFNMKLVAGRSLREDEKILTFDTKNIKVMINEELVKILGYASNEEALHEHLVFKLAESNKEGEVIGVVKNYHQRSLQNKYDPILFYYPAWSPWKYFIINLNTEQISQTMAHIEEEFQQTFPGNAFEYFFLDDYFNRQYEADQRFGCVFSLFTTLAIIVACLGLFGLSAFTMKQRTKEIGIRKVLGASVTNILTLLSGDFVKLILVAGVIALPLAYFAIRQWLSNYAFHIEINFWLFALPMTLILVIAMVTVSVQTIKAALSNPVKSLRQE